MQPLSRKTATTVPSNFQAGPQKQKDPHVRSTASSSSSSYLWASQAQPKFTQFSPKSAVWFSVDDGRGPAVILLSDQSGLKKRLQKFAQQGTKVDAKGVCMSLEVHQTRWGDLTNTWRGRPYGMQADPKWVSIVAARAFFSPHSGAGLNQKSRPPQAVGSKAALA